MRASVRMILGVPSVIRMYVPTYASMYVRTYMLARVIIPIMHAMEHNPRRGNVRRKRLDFGRVRITRASAHSLAGSFRWDAPTYYVRICDT